MTKSHVLRLVMMLALVVTLFSVTLGDHNIHAYAADNSEKQALFTDEELKWLAAHPVIKVAPDPDYAPVEYFDAGTFKGISIDYFNAIAHTYHINFQFVPYNNWSEVLAAAKDGDVHMISAAVATEKRSEYLNFTDAYLTMPTKMFIRSDSNALGGLHRLKGKRIASIRGYSTSEYLSLVAPEVEIILVDNIEEGLSRLSLGEIDGFLGDRGQVGFYLNQLNMGNIVLDQTVDFDFPFNLSVAVIKSEPELLSIMQKIVKSFPQAKLEEIKRSWLKSEWYASGISRGTLLIFGVASIVGVLTVFAFAIWNKILHKRVLIQTRTLEEELNKSRTLEQQMRILIDTIPYPIFTKNSEFRFVTVNKAYADFFGLQPSDFEGVFDQSVYQQNAQTPLNRYRALEEQVLKKQEPAMIEDYYLVDKSGNGHHYKLLKVPCPMMDYTSTGILAIAVDISELKTIEQERLDSLNRLVTNIATQINTPLGNVISSLSYLQFQHLELLNARSQQTLTQTHLQRYQDAVGEVCEIGIKGMQRIQAIMDAFASLALLQEHGEHEKIHLYDLLSIVIASKRNSFNFSFSVDVPEQLVVYGAPKVFEEVFTRIIDNAIEHAFRIKHDSVFSQYKESILKVYYDDIGDLHQLRFCDNGMGITQEKIHRVLDPLYSTTLHLGSLGIGLSISSSLVREVLGGNLTIQNHSEGGLEVAITFKKTTHINL